MNSNIYQIKGYSIELSDTLDIEILKQNWLDIQQTEKLPFFLTWSWIDVWIKTYNPQKLIARVLYNDLVVAIGLFTFSLEHRFAGITSKQLRLHQIGNTSMDQIWMEYNDFIGLSEHRTKAMNACLSALQSDEFDWDEIVISMMSESRGEQILDSNNAANIEIRNPSYLTDLTAIRHSGKTYLDTLTANTRYQIRRSMRQYEAMYGKLSLHLAENEQQALDFFHEAGCHHVTRWTDSGFNNPQFIRFHENLIRACFGTNTINLLRVVSGTTTIAIIYYHLADKRVFFYLHGLLYEKDSKLKPGLVAHSLASQYYLEQGMDVYDYMGGYSQYKQQLAKQSEDLVTIIIQRPRSRFRFERLARKFKNWIMSFS